jgi:hypothetical protein
MRYDAEGHVLIGPIVLRLPFRRDQGVHFPRPLGGPPPLPHGSRRSATRPDDEGQSATSGSALAVRSSPAVSDRSGVPVGRQKLRPRKIPDANEIGPRTLALTNEGISWRMLRWR